MTEIDGLQLAIEPLRHQLERWRRTRDLPMWATHWEQGTGKTYETIMEAAWLRQRGEIDAAVVLAPSGIHTNWSIDEVPRYWPPGMDMRCIALRTEGLGTKRHAAELADALVHPGMVFLCASYEAIDTEDRKPRKGSSDPILGGKSWIKEFLLRRKVMLIADETSRLKNPTARRTILACKAAQLAPYRRSLNGTPVTNSPFDLYSQVCFLDPIVGKRGRLQGKFWISKGISSFEGFKTQFGVWDVGYTRVAGGKLREYPKLVEYKNLDLLRSWMEEVSDRVTKEQVLDLPPKSYRRATFRLTGPQRRVYDELKEECRTRLDSGELVTVTTALTLLLRLQQVCNGYVSVVTEDGEPIRDICADNPRLDLLLELCEDLDHKAIVWTRFKRDAELICAALAARGRTVVRYDGTVDEVGRQEAKRRFRTDEAQFFVGSPACAGAGLTLLGDQSEGADESLACKTVIYYANSHDQWARGQSEDRAHRIGQRWPVQYIDIVAEDTVDGEILSDLQGKQEVACQINGDRLRRWLT